MIYENFKHGVLFGVISTKITQTFGQKTFSFHTGIDIKPADNSLAKIIAYERAKVKQVSYTTVSGYFVILEHNDNTLTEYRHLAKGSIPVKEGQVIERNSIVGTEGNTGTVTGYHLHFAVKINGVYVDPLPYLKDYKSIAPFKENYIMSRPEMPLLRNKATKLYYRDAPAGERIAYLPLGDYPYTGKSQMIDGYEWGEIIYLDELVYVALNELWNEIVMPPKLPLPFKVSGVADGQNYVVELIPVNNK